jgi:zinc protease
MKDVLLPSGLRLLLDEEPGATTAGVVSVVAGGSTEDPIGGEGLAHLVEHLTFRAVDAAAGPGTRWDRLTRLAVAEVNGFTTRDALVFYEFAPAAELDALLALETARLTAPLPAVDDEVFAIERQVVGSEHLYREDPRAGGWAANALLPRLFAAPHPYARGLSGTDESRRKLTLADARAFAARIFRPERMTLLVAAPPDTVSLEELIDKLPPALRGEPGKRTARAAPATAAPVGVPPRGPEHLERKGSPLPRPELWIGWRLPAAVGDADAALEVLARWLQQDVGSEQVIQEDSKIRQVRVSLQPGAIASALLVRVLLADGADAEKAAQVVIARVASAWSREPQEQDGFADLKGLFETERLLDEPEQLPRALEEAMSSALGDRAVAMADRWSALQAVSSTAAAKLAYEHLTRDKARAVMFTPAPADAARAPAAPSPAPASAAASKELIPGAGAWDAKELRALAPPAVDVRTKRLDDGLTIVTVRRPGAAVRAWLAFRGGYSDADPPLLVELAARGRPDAQRAVRMHMLPGRGATRDLSFDVVEFPPSQLPEALTLLFAKATLPVKDWPPPEALERILAPLAAEEDALSRKVDAAFLRALFGEHPHARIVSTADLDKVTRSDVDAWLGRVHASRNAALVVVGDVEPGEVERIAGVLSAHIKAPAWVADVAAPRPVAVRPAGPEHVVPVVMGRPGALTDVRMGCLLPPMADADAGHYALLKHAVQARLNAALRFEHGDSYGVGVEVERLRGGTTFLLASTFVGDESLGHSLAAWHALWQRWSRAGFDASELNVARWHYAATLPFRNASGPALAGQILDAWSASPAGPRGSFGLAGERRRAARRARERALRHVQGQRGARPHRQRGADPARARAKLARPRGPGARGALSGDERLGLTAPRGRTWARRASSPPAPDARAPAWRRGAGARRSGNSARRRTPAAASTLAAPRAAPQGPPARPRRTSRPRRR